MMSTSVCDSESLNRVSVEREQDHRGSARLDVWEPATGTVFDYKFGNAVLSLAQVNKITTQGPLGIQQIIPVRP